jgi:hypothetical protein
MKITRCVCKKEGRLRVRFVGANAPGEARAENPQCSAARRAGRKDCHLSREAKSQIKWCQLGRLRLPFAPPRVGPIGRRGDNTYERKVAKTVSGRIIIVLSVQDRRGVGGEGGQTRLHSFFLSDTGASYCTATAEQRARNGPAEKA